MKYLVVHFGKRFRDEQRAREVLSSEKPDVVRGVDTGSSLQKIAQKFSTAPVEFARIERTIYPSYAIDISFKGVLDSSNPYKVVFFGEPGDPLRSQVEYRGIDFEVVNG